MSKNSVSCACARMHARAGCVSVTMVQRVQEFYKRVRASVRGWLVHWEGSWGWGRIGCVAAGAACPAVGVCASACVLMHAVPSHAALRHMHMLYMHLNSPCHSAVLAEIRGASALQRHFFPTPAAMPKRISAEDKSQEWVDISFKRWERSRGYPQPLTQEEQQQFRTSDMWGVQGAMARDRARQQREEELDAEMLSNGAGAARPAFDDAWLNLKEAKLLWKSLTWSAFGAPGQFEPQQYVSIVAGRPTVVIGNRDFTSGRSVHCVSVRLSRSPNRCWFRNSSQRLLAFL